MLLSNERNEVETKMLFFFENLQFLNFEEKNKWPKAPKVCTTIYDGHFLVKVNPI